MDQVRAIESKFKDLKAAVDKKCGLSDDLRAIVDQTREEMVKKLKAAFQSEAGLDAAAVLPELLRRGVDIDIVTDQTSAHDPLSYLPIDMDEEKR